MIEIPLTEAAKQRNMSTELAERFPHAVAAVWNFGIVAICDLRKGVYEKGLGLMYEKKFCGHCVQIGKIESGAYRYERTIKPYGGNIVVDLTPMPLGCKKCPIAQGEK